MTNTINGQVRERVQHNGQAHRLWIQIAWASMAGQEKQPQIQSASLDVELTDQEVAAPELSLYLWLIWSSI